MFVDHDKNLLLMNLIMFIPDFYKSQSEFGLEYLKDSVKQVLQINVTMFKRTDSNYFQSVNHCSD